MASWGSKWRPSGEQEQQATPSPWTGWEKTWVGERPDSVELRLVRRVLQVDLRDASGKCRMPFLLELTADRLFSWGRKAVAAGNAKWAAEVICMGETWPMLFVQCHLERGKPTCMTLQKKKIQLGILLKTWWLDASHGKQHGWTSGWSTKLQLLGPGSAGQTLADQSWGVLGLSWSWLPILLACLDPFGPNLLAIWPQKWGPKYQKRP